MTWKVRSTPAASRRLTSTMRGRRSSSPPAATVAAAAAARASAGGTKRPRSSRSATLRRVMSDVTAAGTMITGVPRKLAIFSSSAPAPVLRCRLAPAAAVAEEEEDAAAALPPPAAVFTCSNFAKT